ncbi:GGDEF domain-containing protein [Sphingomonadaceae bacterium OTU29LAMAA1]|nr:GGDEF domain-containing protein [Sphingomonadaceae bacterium OTU29LAMAA1]
MRFDTGRTAGRMNALAAPAHSRLARLSSWLGGHQNRPPVHADAHDDTRDRNRQLFCRIGAFLETHDLAPTTEHYDLARRYVSGDDIALRLEVDRHLTSQPRIDARFVRSLTSARPDAALHPEGIAAMADALAVMLADSETTVHQSHASARDYHSALSAEADAAHGETGATMVRLLGITTEAIARTRDLATRLEATHRETRALRVNLEQARQAADEDHLTGLANRRCFDGRLHAANACEDDSGSHCVALCDIDDFKAINDRHGHDTGDRVLKLVARQLTTDLGRTVLVARHGGEEFACLFERCSPATAHEKLDDVRERLGARTLVDQSTGRGIGNLSFSAGIAVLGDDPSAAMRAADAALYAAKRAGKNRVVLAPA